MCWWSDTKVILMDDGAMFEETGLSGLRLGASKGAPIIKRGNS
jgi:hypothetical protein